MVCFFPAGAVRTIIGNRVVLMVARTVKGFERAKERPNSTCVSKLHEYFPFLLFLMTHPK